MKIYGNLTRQQAEHLKKQGIDYVANTYVERSKLIEEELPKVWSILDKEEPGIRKRDYTLMGIAISLIE